MMQAIRRSAFTAVFVLTATATAFAQNDRCSRDQFSVDGTTVTAATCAPASADSKVTIALTLSAGGASLSHATTLDLLPGSVSRTIDDISLEKLGLKRTLHVTLAYRAGTAILEHALLLPGAVPIK